MPRTKEISQEIEEKLKYLGLDLDNIPEILKNEETIEYKPSKTYEEENKYKVYQYVDVSKIKILLTPCNRLDDLAQKYKLASPIHPYLKPEKEEDITKYATFLNMVSQLKEEEIEKIEEQQKKMSTKVPFNVKYENNYLWQIYYSEYSGQYFMLVATEDRDYSAFFYIIKKKIESMKNKKTQKIFVPISHLDYTNEYLKNSEIEEIEKYLWLFTKEWTHIYEVFNKKNELKIEILGQVQVFENVVSSYKITLETKQQAIGFYRLLKALFILQTELETYYPFKVKINKDAGLQFYYETEEITYEKLPSFIEEQYKQKNKEKYQIEKNIKNEEELLNKLKKENEYYTLEYLAKEKQIATYLQCKKTFFGKIKYFFKNSKTKKKEEVEKEEENKVEKIQEYTEEILPKYTIDDLVEMGKKVYDLEKREKNIILDKKALENKVEILKLKVKNATLYIQEIEEHKKSIFEFWKFANKDEALVLQQGQEEIKTGENKLKRTFNFIEDFDELSINMDKIQRKAFSKKETDYLYLLTTPVISLINKIQNNIKIEEEELNELKEELKKFYNNDFDIFGGTQDNTTINMLGNKKHREIQKNKLKILGINEKMTTKELNEELEQIKSNIQNLMKQIKINKEISGYLISNKIEKNNIEILELNPELIVTQAINDKTKTIYKLTIEEGTPLIFLSNSIFYDNKNKTLPVGMDIGSKIAINLQEMNIELKQKQEFRVNKLKDEFKNESILLKIQEYKILKKGEKE